MILGFEAVFASVAAILCLLSFRTFRAIKHLGVGKSFWIPVLASSVLFLTASIVTVLNELNLAPIPQTLTLVHLSRILALSTLLFAILVYSRRVTASLKEEFTIPQHAPDKLSLEVQLPEKEPEAPEEKGFRERMIQPQSTSAATTECQHQLGYLRTLPRNAPLPTECFSCDQIIECKHPLVDTRDSCVANQ
jgi:hypothetical protein